MNVKKKNKEKLQYRYYEMQGNSLILPKIGKEWIRSYGHDIDCLHFHNHLEIGYCIFGEGNMQYDEKMYQYESGTYTFIPPFFPHTTISKDAQENYWEYLFVDVRSLLSKYIKNDKRLDTLVSVIYGRIEFFTRDKYPEYAHLIDEIFKEIRSEGEYYTIISENLMLNLFLQMVREGKKEIEYLPYPKKIDPALRYIEEHLEEEMDIGALAKRCLMSETHFRRVFKEYMKISPLTYLNSKRVSRACSLLNATDDSIYNISIKCGFNSLITMNRNFEKFLGVTPLEWRKHPKNYRHHILEKEVDTRIGW